MGRIVTLAVAVLMAGSGVSAAAVEPAESARMLRAKDLISDERWDAAITELRAAVADPKEQSKDEALFWLAHSQNQIGDLAEAVESVQRLQRDYPKSRWTVPSSSLMIELAQKLGRRDVLWWAAAATPPPLPPAPPATTPAPVVRPRAPRTGPVPAPDMPPPSSSGRKTPPAPPAPAAMWFSQSYPPGTELRIQALGMLLRTDAQKVIPMLRNIALKEDPGPAKSAVFVLAQSRVPEAQSCVIDVAKSGPEPVRIAAVRELARFGGSNISRELLDVYSTANWPVKQQVVLSLGERADTTALLRIAQSESDDRLLETAIVTLGKAGGSAHLRGLHPKSRVARRAVIRGLFNARDEEGLIRIAQSESDSVLRNEALNRLRLLDTPKAKGYLESLKK